MDYRTGKCSQCGAEYKVPASFAHNVARCKVCKGVVHLGPPQTAGASASAGAAEPKAAPAAMPARKVVPKPAAPTAASAPPPSAQKPVPVAPAPRPAAAAAARSERRPEPPAAGPAARPAAARAREQDEPAPSAARERRGRAAPREKKKAPVAGLVAGVALVAVAAGVFLFRDSLFGGSQPKDEVVGAAPSVTPEAPAPSAEPAPAAEREPVAAEPEAPKVEKAAPKPKDPSSIDLTAITDFEPTSDTSAEEWAQMNEWMTEWMDVDAGAAGNRAKLKLLENKRKAVPAILNFFKKQDFATKEGRSNGDQCQKALMQICNGTNFDWRYADDAAGKPVDFPDDVYFCKRVVEEWVKAWRQVEQNIEAWINLAKLNEKDPAEAARLREMFGGQASTDPSTPSSDDLEVD